MKVKVGDKIETPECGEGIIVFIGTETVVYRDNEGCEWVEHDDEVSAVIPCEIEFASKPKKEKK